MKSATIFNRWFGIAISESWEGWTVGLLSLRIVSAPELGPKKALRIVVWRLAMWIEL